MNSFCVLDPIITNQNIRRLCALAVVTKVPQAGHVKTRLVPTLTPSEAAELNKSIGAQDGYWIRQGNVRAKSGWKSNCCRPDTTSMTGRVYADCARNCWPRQHQQISHRILENFCGS